MGINSLIKFRMEIRRRLPPFKRKNSGRYFQYYKRREENLINFTMDFTMQVTGLPLHDAIS